MDAKIREDKAQDRERESVKKAAVPAPGAEYLRAANEDDDGYDPYSDRPATPEPLFERDPWS